METIEVPGKLEPPGGWGHAGEVAIRKAHTPGWTPFRIETVGKTRDALYTGAVETKRKNGKSNWPKPHTQVVVTEGERDAEAARYEREHGRCRKCYGGGQEWGGWSAKDGNWYRPCSRCKATGRPASEPSP